MVLRKKLKSYNKGLSFSPAMAELKSLKAIGINITDMEVISRTQLKTKAKEIFEALSMRPPNRILSSDDLKIILV